MYNNPQFCLPSSTMFLLLQLAELCTHTNWGHREGCLTEVYKVCVVKQQAFLMFITLRCEYFSLVSIRFCWCSWWPLLRMDLLLHTKRLCHEVLIHSPIFNTPRDCHLLCFPRAPKPDPNSVSMWFFALWTFHSRNGSTATGILSFFRPFLLSVLSLPSPGQPLPCCILHLFCSGTVHKYNCEQKISFYKWKTVTEWESSCEAITLYLCPNQIETSVFS